MADIYCFFKQNKLSASHETKGPVFLTPAKYSMREEKENLRTLDKSSSLGNKRCVLATAATEQRTKGLQSMSIKSQVN